MAIAADDIVRSAGRIQTIQDGRPRFLSFDRGKVIEVTEGGVTVNPVGMRALVFCRMEDLEEVEPTLKQTPQSQASAEVVAELNKEDDTPAVAAVSTEVTGDVPVVGEAEPAPKPRPKRKPKPKAKPLKVVKAERETEDAPKPKTRKAKPAAKPKPTTRRRRRDR